MKKLLLISVAGCCLFSACSKSSSSSPSPSSGIPTDGWTLGSTKYKQLYCLRQADQFILNCVDGTTSPINSFAVGFKAYPATSGTYHIVNLVADPGITYPGQNIGDNDIVIAGAVPGKTYWSIGTENKVATVTVTSGKIKVEVPSVKIVNNTDTLSITGTMIENM